MLFLIDNCYIMFGFKWFYLYVYVYLLLSFECYFFFFFGWYDDFLIYLVDICFEYWEMIMDCKWNVVVWILFLIFIVDIFELEFLCVKFMNIFCILWIYYILV